MEMAFKVDENFENVVKAWNYVIDLVRDVIFLFFFFSSSHERVVGITCFSKVHKYLTLLKIWYPVLP